MNIFGLTSTTVRRTMLMVRAEMGTISGNDGGGDDDHHHVIIT
jgi:hypothetical protein